MFVVIDTSGKKGSLSIEENGTIVYSVNFNNFNSHSSSLTKVLNYALETIKKDLKDITKVGVVDGPGSFTGLRISFAYFQGLTLGKEIERYKMSSIYVPVAFMKQNYEKHYKGFYNVIKIKAGFNVIARFDFNNLNNPEISVFEEDFNLDTSGDYLYISNSNEVDLAIDFVDYYMFNLNSSAEFINSIQLLKFEKISDEELFSPDYFKKSEAEIAKKSKK